MVKKQLLVSVVALGLMVGMAAVRARADITQVVFSGGDIRFTGSGGTVVMDFLCGGVVCNSIGGFAGTEGTLLVAGTYTLTKSGGITLAGDGSITQDNPIAFSFVGDGNTLTGDLHLVSFVLRIESSESAGIGFAGNLTNIGGTLAGDFPGTQGMVSIGVPLNLSGGVFNPFEQDGTIDSFLGGSINPTPVPEPGSMLLILSGLAAGGGFLRRRGA